MTDPHDAARAREAVHAWLYLRKLSLSHDDFMGLADIIAAALTAARRTGAEEALKWLRGQVVALCEATEDNCAADAERDADRMSGAFARGRVWEAKGIRNSICEVVRERLTALPLPSPPAAEANDDH